MSLDVVIVGGGPNGLLLACELRLAGVAVTVLEQRDAPGGEPRANGLVGRVVQALDLRNLYEPLSGQAGPAQPTPRYQFGGLPLDLTELADNPLFTLPVPQARIEQVLAARAQALGADIRRGHHVTEVEPHDDRVTLRVRGPEGEQPLATRWLVGADGAHSLVRKQLGIDFPGTTDDRFVSHIGHAHLPADRFHPDGSLTLPSGERVWPYAHNRVAGGVFIFATLHTTGGTHLVAVQEWTGGDTTTPVTFTDLQHAVNRVAGGTLPLRQPAEPAAILRRLAGVNLRQATTYRAGRALLLGDAAHVYPAVGGPGLNLGLQDTLNLGWKLAAQVQGWAPPGLLDTYENERAPIGRRVALQTRAQLALLAPGDDVTAVRNLLADLLRHAHTRRDVAALLAGADTPYDMKGGDGEPHPLTGGWLPDLLPHLTEGRRDVLDRIRSGRPVLLTTTTEGATTAAGWGDRIDVVHVAGTLDAPTLLVRPDAYVAWAGEPDHGLTEALHQWFGRPR